VKLLLDSNVIVSGLLSTKSSPGQLMRLWRERYCEWVTCEQQLAELTVVLCRPWVASRVDGSLGSVYAFMREFHGKTTQLTLEPPFEPVCRAPNDDFLLAMLTRHPIDFLVSGDKDLLSLKHLYPTILTPRELIDRL